jgi:hypothetical protein
VSICKVKRVQDEIFRLCGIKNVMRISLYPRLRDFQMFFFFFFWYLFNLKTRETKEYLLVNTQLILIVKPAVVIYNMWMTCYERCS